MTMTGPRSEPPMPMFDVGNRFALVAFPRSGADLLGKVLHMLSGGLHLRHQVFTLDDQGLIGWATESDMKDSTIFSKIDFIATKHSISEFFNLGLFEKLAEEFESFLGDAVFGVVDEEIVPTMG